MDSNRTSVTLWQPKKVAMAVLALFGTNAYAINFELDNGVTGAWNTTITLGQSWRTEDADPRMIGRSFDNSGAPKGGVGTDAIDDGELNFRRKGSIFSTQMKAISDVEMKYQNYGAVVRGKAWYDFTLNEKKVVQGNEAGPPGAWTRLSDNGFEKGNGFDGVKLLDAMAYGSWDLANSNLNIRLGRQAVIWGENLFVQGVSQINPIDVTALRKPGAEIKEAFLPVNMLYANWGLNDGPSIEAFYQFKWEKTQLDPCGTLFSGFDGGISDRSCSGITINSYYSTFAAGLPTPAGATNFSTWYNDAFHMRNGLVLGRRDDREPGDSGQWGIATRYLSESLGAEFGAYYMNVHAKTPIVSVTKPNMTLTTPNAALLAAGAPAATAILATRLQSINYWWEYPEDIKYFGLSMATSLSGWSVGAELSFTRDLPVQLNGSDMFNAAVAGIGPLASRAATLAVGQEFSGFDRLDKTQLQINGVKVYTNVLGAGSLSLAAEVAASQVDNLPSLSTARYGRGFQYGFATGGTGLPSAVCRQTTNPLLGNLDGCEAKGYVTEHAWGYRLRGQLSYSNLITGMTLSPAVYWAHDVDGYAADGQFVEDRQVLGLSLRAEYQKRYFSELSYTRYGDKAKYDTLTDKDFVSFVIGASF